MRSGDNILVPLEPAGRYSVTAQAVAGVILRVVWILVLFVAFVFAQQASAALQQGDGIGAATPIVGLLSVYLAYRALRFAALPSTAMYALSCALAAGYWLYEQLSVRAPENLMILLVIPPAVYAVSRACDAVASATLQGYFRKGALSIPTAARLIDWKARLYEPARMIVEFTQLHRRESAEAIANIRWNRRMMGAGVFGVLYASPNPGPLWFGIMIASGVLALDRAARLKETRIMLASQARTADPRPEVLLLRSFREDGRSLLPEPVSRFYPLLNSSLESIVARELTVVGPVVSIGDPATGMRPDGASREFIERGTDWFSHVRTRVENARLIALLAGEIPDDPEPTGVEREITLIRESGHLDKTVFIVTPQDRLDVDAWTGRHLPEFARHADPHLLDLVRRRRILAFGITPSGSWAVAGGVHTGDAIAYATRAALSIAMPPDEPADQSGDMRASNREAVSPPGP